MSVNDIWARYAKAATVDHSDVEAHNALMNGGGFSRHVRTGEEPKSGYMVGLHNDMGGEEAVHDLGELTPQHIADHRARAQGDYYQGGWAHDGKAYLDRSVNVQDHDQAVEMGRKHKQLAIWDIANSREVPLG